MMDEDSAWDDVTVMDNSDYETASKEDYEDKNQGKTFEIKDYIPRRSKMKYLKHWFIISGISIISLIIIIAVTVSLGKSTIDRQRHKVRFYKKLIFYEDNRLWVYDLKSKNFTLLHQAENSIDAFEVYTSPARDTIFWSDSNSSKINALSTNYETDKGLNFSFEEVRMKAQRITIDFISENLYVVDEVTGILIVINTQNNYHNIILSDLSEPHDICLDPVDGLMFIQMSTNAIMKANMDGSMLTKIVDDTHITGITIDRKAKRLYWIKDLSDISSCDYNGENRTSFSTDFVIASLTILDDHLFWLWQGYKPIEATVWSCKLINGTCQNHSMIPVSYPHTPKSMKACTNENQEIAPIEHPCRIKNNECQHLCLVASNSSHRCACNLGWQLNPDLKTCREIAEFILYTQDNIIRAQTLRTESLSLIDVIWPTKFYTESMIHKAVLDFDYDLYNDIFYFSDDSNLYKMKLKGNGKQESIVQVIAASNYIIEDVAYDWLSRNLYYSLCSKLSSQEHLIELRSIENNLFKKIVFQGETDFQYGIRGCPYALVVDPRHGYLFFTAIAKKNSGRSIHGITLNGTALWEIPNINYVHEYRLIAVDYDDSRIYWISETGSQTSIRNANFDGSDVKLFQFNFVERVRTIYVHRQWLYLSNDTSIWRLEKKTGKIPKLIVPAYQASHRPKIAGVRVISQAVQSIGKDHTCNYLNHLDCAEICFSGPKKTCDCSDNKILQSNGKCE